MSSTAEREKAWGGTRRSDAQTLTHASSGGGLDSHTPSVLDGVMRRSTLTQHGTTRPHTAPAERPWEAFEGSVPAEVMRRPQLSKLEFGEGSGSGSKPKRRSAEELFKIAKDLVKPYVQEQRRERAPLEPPSSITRKASDFMLREAAALLGSRTRNSSSVIDERHMWLSKRISQGFGVSDVSDIQQILTSKEVLDRVGVVAIQLPS